MGITFLFRKTEGSKTAEILKKIQQHKKVIIKEQLLFVCMVWMCINSPFYNTIR